MIKKSIRDYIHNCILYTWKYDIDHDFNNNYFLREATLVDAFYYYLRRKIDNLDNIRIFTEYWIDGYCADMVVVKVKDTESWNIDVEEVVSVIEFKYKNQYAGGTIKDDFKKMKDYIYLSKFPKCRYYVASIHDCEHKRGTYLDKRSYNNWANGSLTELNAFLENDKMKFCIYDSKGEVNI